VLLTSSKCVIIVSAITAFAILVIMFWLESNNLGTGLCVGNLGLRLLEAMRCAQLHFRAQNYSAAREHDEKLMS
jgi:hypothetical protein